MENDSAFIRELVTNISNHLSQISSRLGSIESILPRIEGAFKECSHDTKLQTDELIKMISDIKNNTKDIGELKQTILKIELGLLNHDSNIHKYVEDQDESIVSVKDSVDIMNTNLEKNHEDIKSIVLFADVVSKPKTVILMLCAISAAVSIILGGIYYAVESLKPKLDTIHVHKDPTTQSSVNK